MKTVIIITIVLFIIAFIAVLYMFKNMNDDMDFEEWSRYMDEKEKDK